MLTRRGTFVLILMLILALGMPSCSQSGKPTAGNAIVPAPTEGIITNAVSSQDFAANLTGFEEMPRIYTSAKGQAIFKLSIDGTSLGYKLVAANTYDITRADLHQGAPGQNGPAVALLYHPTPPAVSIPGRFDGILGEGTILSTNLVGPLAGRPLSALVDLMKTSGAYVNISTENFPDGEIRGQVNLQSANATPVPLVSESVGTVTAITGNDVSVMSENRTVAVIKDAGTIVDTGDVGPSGQLAVGSAVRVVFDTATHVAFKIELEKPEDVAFYSRATFNVEGTIVSISGSYVIVRTASGELALVQMMGSTILQFQDGTPGVRADVRPGVMLEAVVRVATRWADKIELKR